MGMIDKSKEVLRILEEKKINVDDNVIELDNLLDRTNKVSKEYRFKDIEKIKIHNINNSMCRIEVNSCDSPDIDTEGLKTAILNFASSKNPGGGFLRGAVAQEENICYRSNLYSILKEHNSFYEYNRNHLYNALYSDGIIYTERVCFFKSYKLHNVTPFVLDVITCAAPNCGAARRQGVSYSEINSTMYRRIEQILKVAIDNQVEHLVLGAFGCGVFRNNPSTVAGYMKELIVDKGYGKHFKKITFAMHDDASTNSITFRGIFS